MTSVEVILPCLDEAATLPEVLGRMPAGAGGRIAQVPVSYRPRQGHSKVTGTPLGAWRAVRDSSMALRS